jgi:hypothetical protein
MYDLKTEALPDGNIRLEQSAGSLEESVIIDLHPIQIRLIRDAVTEGVTRNSNAERQRRYRQRQKAIVGADDMAVEGVAHE